jgi:hypothetical protein
VTRAGLYPPRGGSSSSSNRGADSSAYGPLPTESELRGYLGRQNVYAEAQLAALPGWRQLNDALRDEMVARVPSREAGAPLWQGVVTEPDGGMAGGPGGEGGDDGHGGGYWYQRVRGQGARRWQTVRWPGRRSQGGGHAGSPDGEVVAAAAEAEVVLDEDAEAVVVASELRAASAAHVHIGSSKARMVHRRT